MNSKLINHKNKCRCCLAKFRRRDDKLLITPIIQQKFQDLTRAELKLTDEYSKFICHNCFTELNATDKLRRSIMIESQVKISDYKDHPVKYAKTALELDAINKQKALLKQNSRKVIVPKISDKTENTANNKTITEGNILQKLEEPATNIFQNDNEYESKCRCCEILINELDELQLD